MSEDAPAIEVLTTAAADDAEDLKSLLAQLSSNATIDVERLAEIVDHDATSLLVVRLEGRIKAMATLVTVPLPSGIRGHVEDVVVDESLRGQGIARRLLIRMTEMAREQGLRTLDLTSRPARTAALRLYESVGFEVRDTNTLRFVP
jgi:ribosomal protein S18 acetylase RimI-like enzyme